eukprot:SAG22_NODE_52_length_24288_cov_15.594568_13_plen_76_part_00
MGQSSRQSLWRKAAKAAAASGKDNLSHHKVDARRAAKLLIHLALVFLLPDHDTMTSKYYADASQRGAVAVVMSVS